MNGSHKCNRCSLTLISMDSFNNEYNSSDITLTTSMNPETRSHIPHLWKLDYLVLSVIISILSLIGIIGNIPVLIVYFRRKDKKASNTFIKILAFVDLFACVFIMPYTIVYEFHLVQTDVVCRTFELVRHFTVAASNLTLVAIATERYIAVCQIGTKVSVNGINKGVMGIIIVSAVLAAPSVGTFAVVDATDVRGIECTFPHDVAPGRFCHFTYTVMGQLLVTAYQALLMITFFVELIVIVVLYTIVYVVLWNKTKIRRQLNRKRESFTAEYEGMYAGNIESFKQLTPIHEEGSSQGEETNENTPNSAQDTVENVNTTTVCNENETTKTQTSPRKKSDLVVSQKNNAVIAKPLSMKKKVSISFGAADKPQKKRYYHRRTAKMLFMCTVIYFVTWVPFWMDIFGLTNSKVIRYIFFVGHATNPIVYGIVNEQVRRSFKRLLLSCFKRRCDSGKFSGGRENSVNSTSGTEIKVAT